MAVKVYKKRGNQDYKTKKKIKELQEVIGKKIEEDPSFKFEPATNKEELEKLYEIYCSEEVEFEEVESNEPTESLNTEVKKEKESMKNSEEAEEVEFEEIAEEPREEAKFIDPFNRDEPKVRDYVLGDSYENDKENKEVDTNYNFEEPKSEKEAFEYGDNVGEEEEDNSDAEKENSGENRQRKVDKKPMNPDFDSMSKSKQKKATKRFAQSIVSAVTSLAEKGFIWFANKDITEAKIVEYEMEGEMNLDLLISLGNGQEATVRQFFKHQRLQAEQLAKIDDDLKEELVDALTEVFLEKGIAPTPTQNLIIVGLNVIGTQVITMIGLTAQTNSVLTQLRQMNQGDVNQENDDTQETTETESFDDEKIKEEMFKDTQIEEVVDTTKIIGETVNTKE